MEEIKGIEERVEIPESVDFTVVWPTLKIKGPKGQLEREFKGPLLRFVSMEKDGKSLVIKSSTARRKVKALIGSMKAHIRNQIIGVTKGYTYKLKMHYIHFPMTVEIKGTQVIVKNFLGERTLRKTIILGKCKVENKKDEIIVTGVDKDDVAQTAANIENSCRLVGKDRRVFLDGIYITEKIIGEYGEANK